MSNIIIKQAEGDTVEIKLCLEQTPEAYKAKLLELMKQSGVTEIEAIVYIQQNPVPMQVFYQQGVGLFAIESETAEHSDIYNPFTRMLIHNECNPYIEPDPIKFLDTSINELTDLHTDLKNEVYDKHDFELEDLERIEGARELIEEALNLLNEIDLTAEREKL